ncbi:MAG: hypothetical protein Ct9H90mP8_2880 [Pseudomonadota bacterium]|nr:MAG: hypothetical protein Ct9H90mP8_2880 [Pseudomonadota bacterium]
MSSVAGGSVAKEAYLVRQSYWFIAGIGLALLTQFIPLPGLGKIGIHPSSFGHPALGFGTFLWNRRSWDQCSAVA